MTKKWLIRTKSNHILGPVTREKIIELLQNKSLKEEDELCSANGYWFFVRESELLEKYVIGDAPQGFNPISEAKDVLSEMNQDVQKKVDDVQALSSATDNTLVSNNIINLGVVQKKKSDSPELTPSSSKKISNKKMKKSSELTAYSDSKKIHVIIGFLFFLVLVGIYYRKMLFRSTSYNIGNIFISTANAQVEVKKKLLLKL